MYIKTEFYNGKDTEILYPDDGFVLEHKTTHLQYGAVSLEDGRKQSDYIEVQEPEESEPQTKE